MRITNYNMVKSRAKDGGRDYWGMKVDVGVTPDSDLGDGSIYYADLREVSIQEALKVVNENPPNSTQQATNYAALKPLIDMRPLMAAPTDSLDVWHPRVFRLPVFISDALQVFLFKDARTGASEIPITESGFQILKELKADTDGVTKVFISKTPANVQGQVFWAQKVAGATQKNPITVDVKAGANQPAGPLRVKVTQTAIETWP
jgi:hypothetical protein